jgi:hypothetical protein
MLRISLALLAAAAIAAPPALAHDHHGKTVRFATFNASVNRNAAGQLLTDLQSGTDPQLRNVAEIIQRARPDVLLVNEFDFYPDEQAAKLFQRNYLSVSQHGARPIEFPYRFVKPSNTGIASGKDLDNDGQVVTTPGTGAYGNDAFGFGEFPGKFGLAVFSRLPIDYKRARTFQHFLWKDMPGALLPDDPNTAAPHDWYSPDELAIFRLSSKSHWDVPIEVGHGDEVHFLVSHPTPPVFDGPEDRNGTRNHDEIRFWADYTNPVAGGYIYDDNGRARRPQAPRALRHRGRHERRSRRRRQHRRRHPAAARRPADQHERHADEPGRPRAVGAAGPDQLHPQGQPAFDTADFADALPAGPGNLRADYVLPDRATKIVSSFVFWPLSSDPLFGPVGTFDPALLPNGNGFPSSDHRLVAVDVRYGR